MRPTSLSILACVVASAVVAAPPASAGPPLTRTQDQIIAWDFPSMPELPPTAHFGATLAVGEGSAGEAVALIGAPGAPAGQHYELGPGEPFWTPQLTLLGGSPQPLPADVDTSIIIALLDFGGATTSIEEFGSTTTLVSGIGGGPVETLVKKGDILAVGQPEFFGSAGRVLIYERNSAGTWHLAATFAGGLGDELGRSLAIDGSVLVAGAPKAGDNGAVHIYARGSIWVELQVIDSPAANQLGAEFGGAVALAGDLLAVGSRLLDRTTAPSPLTNSGGVYIYEVVTFPFLEFELQALLRPPTASDHDWFGTSVDLEELTPGWPELVAGAPGEDDGAMDAGAVYRYLRSKHQHASGWRLADRLTSSQPVLLDKLGTTVARGKAGVLAGAPYGSSGEGSNSGLVLFFDARIFADSFESGDASAWTEVQP